MYENRNKPEPFELDKRFYPIPEKSYRQARKKPRPHVAYPFHWMCPGDSFTLPEDERVNTREAARAYTRRWGKRYRFKVMRVSKHKARCWRL